MTDIAISAAAVENGRLSSSEPLIVLMAWCSMSLCRPALACAARAACEWTSRRISADATLGTPGLDEWMN